MEYKLKEIIHNEIKEGRINTTWELFKWLDNNLQYETICKILGVGRSSYFNYKRTGKVKKVEKRLFNLFMSSMDLNPDEVIIRGRG